MLHDRPTPRPEFISCLQPAYLESIMLSMEWNIFIFNGVEMELYSIIHR